MRIKKKLGEKTKALENDEIKAKYFIIFEGEETEYRYFKGIEENRELIGVNTLIQIEPIFRSFNEKGWSNPKKILDRLLVYLHSLQNYKLTIEVLIGYLLDFLVDDGIVDSKNLISVFSLKKEMLEKYYLQHGFRADDDVEDIPEAVYNSVMLLESIKDLPNISEKIIEYIKMQKVTYLKDYDKICLVVDRDKESFTSHPGNNQYDYVVDKCAEEGIKLYLSNYTCQIPILNFGYFYILMKF